MSTERGISQPLQRVEDFVVVWRELHRIDERATCTGMDMDNSNDAADPDTMIRHADQTMKGLTATATLPLVD